MNTVKIAKREKRKFTCKEDIQMEELVMLKCNKTENVKQSMNLEHYENLKETGKYLKNVESYL
jgi:hypothetical protein